MTYAQVVEFCGGDPECIDLLSFEFGYGSPGGSSSGGISQTIIVPAPVVIVNNAVNNAVNIGADAFDAVASAIERELDTANRNMADFVNSAFGKIGSVLSSVADAVWGALKGVVEYIAQNIGSILSGIWDHLKEIFQQIVTWIGKLLVDVGKGLYDVISDLGGVIHDIAKTVQQINDDLLAPIANIINTTVKTIATLTVAIEKDLHEGLSGILRIPGDVSGAMTSLDSTMQRSIEQLGRFNTAAITSIWKPTIREEVGGHLENIGTSLGKLQGKGPTSTSFGIVTHLPDQCNTGVITQWIESIQKEISDSDEWWAKGLKIILDGLLSLNFVLASLEQKKECYTEEARKALPITKLDSGTALAAWRRGFIDDRDLEAELSVKGLDAARIKILQSLQEWLIDPDTALKWWFRGIYNDSELTDALMEQGIPESEIDNVKVGALEPFPVDLAAELWCRGIIDSAALDRAWTAARLSENERGARFGTLLKLPSVLETINVKRWEALLIGGYNIQTYKEQAPDDLILAAKRDRLDPAIANLAWRAHWYVPERKEAIALYFRGLRTRTEIEAIFDYHGVPREIHDELIEIERPLIPRRTVPSMVKAGLLSEARARRILESYGLSEEDSLATLKYALVGNQTSQADTATATHEVSLASAKTLYLDGAITEVQYREILADHGYDEKGVELELLATNTAESVKERKATAQGIVDEAVLGQITYNEAQHELAKANFTVAEQAKYLKAIVKGLKTSSKVPGEAELFKMLAAGIISQDDYMSAMRQNGYDDVWAGRILDLRSGSQQGQQQP